MAGFKDLQVELYEELVSVVARLGGNYYEEDFLFERLMEELDDEGDIGSFVNITLERDW